MRVGAAGVGVAGAMRVAGLRVGVDVTCTKLTGQLNGQSSPPELGKSRERLPVRPFFSLPTIHGVEGGFGGGE